MPNVNFREEVLRDADPLAEHELALPNATPHGTNTRDASPALELWGGIECTVNRVRDEYLDQLVRNGHEQRLSDLDLFAALGIRALRYPVLWERTAPDGPKSADWSWADERLPRLRELDIRPIVGLVHHGSGPRHTSLIEPSFAEGLAEYARAVAERYPWVDAYTPVNEIVTTARFSALYGHWYPHHQDASSFARAIVNQARATVLAMRAIREVNPQAQLVQTDDLGKTFSTPHLAYQARFDNERRWLGWDLLCGRLSPDDLLWDELVRDGIPEAELQWFRENRCPPDVLGVNYYITSERYLDQRLGRYPECTHGGNAWERYADVEAVRVCARGIAGPAVLLREAWERYRRPIAITEAHLGCTREEQLRWFLEVWRTAEKLQTDGVDVRAVTAWSLLGAYDWNSLLTQNVGHYEAGVFDLSNGTPRPTALAALMRELAAGREPQHPALSIPGWWRRPERVLYPPVNVDTQSVMMPEDREQKPSLPAPARKPLAAGRSGTERPAPVRPLVITGSTGTLGRAFARLCDIRGIPYRLLKRQDMDIAASFMVEDVLDQLQPWAVINTAGYVRVDDAEREPERCFRENAEGPAVLAAQCARHGIPLVTFSSDLVFDGRKQAPYTESDPVAPLNVYGRSKAEGERRVLEAHPEALVVRTSAFFGPWDEYNFITAALRELSAGREFVAMEDAVVSPTYVPDLVNTSLDLLLDDVRGIWHLANPGSLTWLELARTAAERAGVDTTRLVGTSTEALALPAPRPLYSVLGSERGLLLPPLEKALERYFEQCEFGLAAACRSEPEDPGRSDCQAWAAPLPSAELAPSDNPA